MMIRCSLTDASAKMVTFCPTVIHALSLLRVQRTGNSGLLAQRLAALEHEVDAVTRKKFYSSSRFDSESFVYRNLLFSDSKILFYYMFVCFICPQLYNFLIVRNER